MEKEEFVKKIANRHKLDAKVVEPMIDALIAELASPFVFPAPGGEVGFLDNSCTNNCPEKKVARRIGS